MRSLTLTWDLRYVTSGILAAVFCTRHPVMADLYKYDDHIFLENVAKMENASKRHKF